MFRKFLSDIIVSVTASVCGTSRVWLEIYDLFEGPVIKSEFRTCYKPIKIRDDTVSEKFDSKLSGAVRLATGPSSPWMKGIKISPA